MKKVVFVCVAVVVWFSLGLAQQKPLKVGFVSTLSGPGGGLGIDVRDGFNLAIKHLGDKLGGLAVELELADDQQNTDVAKQTVERFLKRDKVDFVTGIIFSNILLAVGDAVFESETFYISPNAGPSDYAGAKCNPFFFSAAWQNDNMHEAMGRYVNTRKFENAYVMAPNYPAGKDAVTGFKRFYKGRISGEVYTQLNQLDFSAELAALRAAGPKSVYVFFPGGMGINFIKQYAAAGLLKDIPLFVPGFSADADVIKAVGKPMVGLFNSSHWALELGGAVNKRFVEDFRKTYNRVPTLYAAQGYDTALLIDAAVKTTQGNLGDKAALRKALESASFESTHGPFKLGSNHFPVQNYYVRQVVQNDRSEIINRLVSTVFSNHSDAYVGQCKMK